MFVVVDLLLLARRARDLPAGFGREGSSRDSGSSGDTDPDAARFPGPRDGALTSCLDQVREIRQDTGQAEKQLTVVPLGNAILDAPTLRQV